MELRKWTCILVCILWVSGAPPRARADAISPVDQFKAVFIYNFISYVYWPDEAQEPVIKIGILGDSPLEAPLREISEKRRIKNKKLQVEVYHRIEGLETCQVVFISSGQAGKLKAVLRRLGSRNILTIADTPGLANRGVAINFVLVENKLKFEINTETLHRAGLRASAQLLKLAILVKNEDDG